MAVTAWSLFLGHGHTLPDELASLSVRGIQQRRTGASRFSCSGRALGFTGADGPGREKVEREAAYHETAKIGSHTASCVCPYVSRSQCAQRCQQHRRESSNRPTTRSAKALAWMQRTIARHFLPKGYPDTVTRLVRRGVRCTLESRILE